MPELPEVETVCRGIREHLVNDTIRSVTIYNHRLRVPIPENMIYLCQEQKIQSVSRKAKYFLITLANDYVIIGHFGMSGRFFIYPEKQLKRGKHDHVVWHMQSGKEVVLNDPRRFGMLTMMHKSDIDNHVMFTSLGLEPLSAQCTPDYMYKVVKNKNTVIKNVIMNAKIVTGIGNIYASEILFISGIDPQLPAKNLSYAKTVALVKAIRKVLKDAILSGGSTIRDYVKTSGEAGYFQHQFQVYGREGKACFHCDSMIKRVIQSNRSTFYCSDCQVSS